MKKLSDYYLYLWHDAASENNRLLSSYVVPAGLARVLDLGCGNGVVAKARLAGKIRQPVLYGIDIDPHDLQITKKNGLKTYRANLEDRIPFPAKSFDLVSANQMIEHLSHPDRLLQEIYRVLTPGGYLLLATENLSSWHNVVALLLGWQPFSLHTSYIANIGNPWQLGQKFDFPTHSRHMKVFTLRSLRELVSLHGFTVERWYGAGYYPLPPYFAAVATRLDPYHAAFIGLKARKPK